jgi:peptidylprolyl isomerase
MARSAHPDSANSQFFIMFDDAPFLNGKYTIFGKVISGQNIVDRIKRGEGSNGAVNDPDFMSKVYIKHDD